MREWRGDEDGGASGGGGEGMDGEGEGMRAVLGRAWSQMELSRVSKRRA